MLRVSPKLDVLPFCYLILTYYIAKKKENQSKSLGPVFVNLQKLAEFIVFNALPDALHEIQIKP